MRGDGKNDKGKTKGYHKVEKEIGKARKVNPKENAMEILAMETILKPKDKGRMTKENLTVSPKRTRPVKKAHFARDCWSHVRRVQGQNAAADSASSQSQRARSNNAAGGAAGNTPNNVRRVQHGVSSTLFLDLPQEVLPK